MQLASTSLFSKSDYLPHIATLVFSHMATFFCSLLPFNFPARPALVLIYWSGEGAGCPSSKESQFPCWANACPHTAWGGRQNRLSTHQGSSGGRDEVQMHPGLLRSSVWCHGTETVFRSLCQIKYHGAIPFIFLPQPKIAGSSFKLLVRWYAYLNIPAETALRPSSGRVKDIWSLASWKWKLESYFYNTLHIFMTIYSKTCYDTL